MIKPYSGEQSQIFGEDPQLYDRFRPSYPRELIEGLLADTTDLPALEIGAGTGKATRALLALGKAVHALEPDPRMASVLKVNCGDGPITVQQATLEEADLPPSAFDLALAAQAWHWVDAKVGYDLVADALVQSGMLALVWHYPQPKQGLLGEALKQLYTQLAPSMPRIWPGAKAAQFDPTTEPLSATERFSSWSRVEHRWQRHLDAASLIGWLCSDSEHRLLPVDHRVELMAGVAALVGELDNELVVNMTTVAHLAYRL